MDTENRDELTRKVVHIINQIRPYLQNDGGDVKFVNITDDNIVNVELQGACGCCPHSIITLKNGIEDTIKRHLPEIKSVEAVNMNC